MQTLRTREDKYPIHFKGEMSIPFATKIFRSLKEEGECLDISNLENSVSALWGMFNFGDLNRLDISFIVIVPVI